MTLWASIRMVTSTAQPIVSDLIRNSFRFASRKYWDELSRDLKPIYTAVHAEAAAAAVLPAGPQLLG